MEDILGWESERCTWAYRAFTLNLHKATYYLNQDKVIITGNVELKNDGNIIKGEKLIIDFLTGLSKMESPGTNQKVKMKYSTE